MPFNNAHDMAPAVVWGELINLSNSIACETAHTAVRERSQVRTQQSQDTKKSPARPGAISHNPSNGIDNMGRTCPEQRGITIIELMVVVAIVGILAAIAYPSYQGQVRKAHRNEGQALLMDVASRQEQFYANNKTFTEDMTALGFTTTEYAFVKTNDDGSEHPDNNYRISIEAEPANSTPKTSFIATAERRNAQVRDTTCYDFTIDSTGHRDITNYPGYNSDPPDDPPSGCW